MSEQIASENWSGRLAFILASIGAAVGLGNIWKFPYTTGTSGGSAFVLIYVIAIILIATPIMMSEMIIGRRARASAPTAFKKLAVAAGSTPNWAFVGWIGLLAVFLVFSFYSVIAGWTAAYLVESISGNLRGLSPAHVGENFGAFLADPVPLTLWHLVFTTTTVFVVSRGIANGLERLVKILMPTLFLTLFSLVIYAAITADFSAALEFLFMPDLTKITAPIVLAAVGQAFFSVNVGIGSVLTYSAYLPKDVNLFKSAMTISVGDTLVALLAGLAIFPIVFANNLDPTEGPSLVFVTLSTAFAAMPGGSIIGAAFFAMLLFAALTSSIAMLEATTARMIENGRFSRTQAAVMLGSGTFIVGLATVLSFSAWAGFHPLGMFETFANKTPFDLIDYLVSNLIMPLGGVAYALFAGWWLQREVQVEELGVGDGVWFKLWLALARVLAPIAIALVLLFNLT